MAHLIAPGTAGDASDDAADRRVDFVIGGVQKGGTTALDQVLRQHPAVAMAKVKEPHWFDDDARYARGIPSPSAYHAQFDDPSPSRLRGEATPTYCWWPPAAQRIRDYNAAMKWVVLLRDPVERAYSQWNMRGRLGTTTQSFEEAIDAELRQGVDVPVRQNVGTSYLSRGLYARQLDRILGLFPREQLLVLRSDRLRDDPTGAVEHVADFLGIASMGILPALEAHVGRYAEPLHPEVRARLLRIFAPEIRRLQTLLGWDLSDWLA